MARVKFDKDFFKSIEGSVYVLRQGCEPLILPLSDLASQDIVCEIVEQCKQERKSLTIVSGYLVQRFCFQYLDD